MKRLFDVICSLIVLILVSPILLICAVLIKLDSKGPIFFRQIRVGRGGKPFKIFKFRTMVIGAESQGTKITTKNDSRITSFGSFLRWTKLDELPQFINVLTGQMSCVGPRPEVPEIVEYYIGEQKQVLSVKPGIIGANQILARNESDMYPKGIENTQAYYIKHILPDKLQVDLDYVKRRSFWYDMKILLGGISVTIFGSIDAHIFREARIPALFLLPIDVMIIALSYLLAYALRFEWNIPAVEFTIFLYSLPIVVLTRIVVFLMFRIYENIWKYLGISDLLTIIKACTLSSVIIVVLIFFFGLKSASRSVFMIDWFLVILFVSGLRLSFRILTEKSLILGRFEHIHEIRKNALIIGADDVGEMVLRELDRHDEYKYKVVGFIDDDPQKLGKTIHGIKVIGAIRDITGLAKPFRVDEIFVAIPQLASDEIKSIVNYCKEAEIKTRMVPSVIDSLSGRILLQKVRDIEISDIFGRKPLKIDFSAISEFISNKRVLVTGAGGSIGSELCRQIAGYRPQQLILLDRNENYLHELKCELDVSFKALPMVFKIADITIKAHMGQILKFFRPEIIFHAAAQKHVPLSEDNPDEAVRNNIIGTRILAKLADKYKTDFFIMVSTDKSVCPTSVMGVTKRIAELYIHSFAQTSPTRFVTVRFGNVVNSNGSVVPIFMKQIQKGGPVTVTHPDIERYFMSIPDAVQLILQAVTMGEDGEIFILDMGEPVKIVDLATELIKRAGLKPNRDIKIEFTGLRPGEKMYEQLVGRGEEVKLTSHKQLYVLRPSNSGLKLNELDKEINMLLMFSKNLELKRISQKLHELVPEYVSTEVRVPARLKPVSKRKRIALTPGLAKPGYTRYDKKKIAEDVVLETS